MPDQSWVPLWFPRDPPGRRKWAKLGVMDAMAMDGMESWTLRLWTIWTRMDTIDGVDAVDVVDDIPLANI